MEDKLEKLEKQWVNVFPASIESEPDAILFLSRMSYIAFAQYLLHRKIIPIQAFKRRRIGDVIMHTFDSKTRWGAKLSDMMKGIGSAIKYKYARQAIIMLNENKNDLDEASEVFSVSFAYDNEDCFSITDEHGQTIVSLSYKGRDQFRSQVAYIIRKIILVTGRLRQYSEHMIPMIKLTYYDERTPRDYQPPSFEHCERTFYFEKQPTDYDIGKVTNNFTATAFNLKSYYIENVNELDDIVLNSSHSLHVESVNNDNLLNTTVDSLIGNEFNSVNGGSDGEQNNLEQTRSTPGRRSVDVYEDEAHLMIHDGNEALVEGASDLSPDTTNEEENIFAVQAPKKKSHRAQLAKEGVKKSPPKIKKKLVQQKTVIEQKKRVTRSTLSKKSPSMGRILEESAEEKNTPSKHSVSTKSSVSDEAHFGKRSKRYETPVRRRGLQTTAFKSSIVTRGVLKSPTDETDYNYSHDVMN